MGNWEVFISSKSDWCSLSYVPSSSTANVVTTTPNDITKAGQEIMEWGWKEGFSGKKKSPCKLCKTPQKMPVLVESSNKQVLRQGYRVAGNDFER